MAEKLKILALCDHPLSTSGVAVQARYLLEGLLKTGKYTIRCLGAAVKHASYDVVKVSDDFIIKPFDGFGDRDTLRYMLITEKPDVLFIFTDPRFFIWLWEMEDEVHQVCPIVYNTIWDNDPAPLFNRVLYQGTDLLNCISDKTFDLIKEVVPEHPRVNFIPHALPKEVFYPIDDAAKVLDLKKRVLTPDRGDHFVGLWVNRNAKRKRSNDVLAAWKLFMDMLQQKHGHNKATLIMHTDPLDQQGPNLLLTSERLGVNRNVFFSKERLGFEQMNILHNVSDFGLNISCFPAGTKVITSNGFQDIDAIDVGDSVLTHLGRYMPVTRTFEKQFEGKMHTLHISNADKLAVTGEHPLRVIKQKHANGLPGRNIESMLEHAEWINAADVHVGDYVIDRVENIASGTEHDLDVWSSISDDSYTIRGHQKRSFSCSDNRITYNVGATRGTFAAYKSLKLDEDLAYIIGEWIADGSTHRMGVSFNKRDTDRAELLRQKYERVFGQEARVIEHPRCLTVELRNSSVYAKFMTKLCGEYSEGKRIPRCILTASELVQRAFLAGYQAGDGCILAHKQNGTLTNRVRTVSNALAADLKTLLVMLGYCPHIHDDDNSHGYNPEGRIWTIEWRDRRHSPGSDGSCRTWSVGNIIVARVFGIDVDDVSCPVFNLEVDEDHTYVTSSCIAHNCNEGFGLGTLEAMQCGKPIVALRTGGLQRQVIDHRDGTQNGIAIPVSVRSLVGSQMCPYIYEDYCSNQDIADAIMRLYEMGPEVRRELGQKARDYVLSEFRLEKTVTDWDESLSEVIDTWKKDRASVNPAWEMMTL